MTPNPKISIITPSFNQGQYIEQTICSVVEQGYPNLEYIIIDGGSRDDTVNVLKRYNDRIRYWVSEPDKGQTDAINKGFNLATGDIINWLNSDDYYAPDTLANLAASFHSPATKAVTTIVQNFEEGGAVWDEFTGSHQSGAEYLTQAFNNQPGTFFRKAVWDRYFPLPVQLRFTMDQYLWFCFWLEHQPAEFTHSRYITAFFRRHHASKTVSSVSDAMFNHMAPAFFNEYNLIFWSFFADKHSDKATVLASYFSKEFNYEGCRITFPSCINPSTDVIETVFHLYLFQLLKEDFRCSFFNRLKRNLPVLNQNFIPATARPVLRKMKLATRHPQSFQAYRQLYWGVRKVLQ